MLLYEQRDGQRWVIYDWEREDLVPEEALLIGRYSELSERISEIQTCTLDELQDILGQY